MITTTGFMIMPIEREIREEVPETGEIKGSPFFFTLK